jgi:DNA-binding CsgD family transcriptional regulator
VPRITLLDVALRSDDPRTEAMAKILDLLTLLVPTDVALFYAVNGRLEKYATDPIVAKVDHSRPPDLDRALRYYRERYAKQDPFAPSRFADSDTPLATPQDVGGQRQFSRSWFATQVASTFSIAIVANLYLRAGGRIIAGITLAREPGSAELSPSEIAVLRKAHTLFQHTYVLAQGATRERERRDPLERSGLTPREREIVALIARGASNEEIARALQITRATVKTHITHAFAKLGVANRRQALLLINATMG